MSSFIIRLTVVVIVAVLIGLGIGSQAFPRVELRTTTSIIPTTLTTISTETLKITEIATITYSTIHTLLQTLTITNLQTVTQTSTSTITSISTTVVTTFPRYDVTCEMNQPCGDLGLIIVAYRTERRSTLGFFRPQDENDYLVVDISIQNVRTDSLSYSQLFFKVKDADNREYSTTLACSALTGYLPGGGELRPGETVRGFICFEVPKTQTKFILKYTDLFRDIRIDIRLS